VAKTNTAGGCSVGDDDTSVLVAVGAAAVVGAVAAVVGEKAAVVGAVAPVVGEEAAVVGAVSPLVGEAAAVVGEEAAVVGAVAPVVGEAAAVVGATPAAVGAVAGSLAAGSVGGSGGLTKGVTSRSISLYVEALSAP